VHKKALEAGKACKNCLTTNKFTKGCRACMGTRVEQIRINQAPVGFVKLLGVEEEVEVEGVEEQKKKEEEEDNLNNDIVKIPKIPKNGHIIIIKDMDGPGPGL
jgi:hypothetical protein